MQRRSLLALGGALLAAPRATLAAALADAPRGVVDVRSRGARGDGKSDDRAAIRSSFATSRRVFFPEGDYYLGQTRGDEFVFDLRELPGLEIITAGRVRFLFATRGDGRPSIFVLSGGCDVRIGDLTLEDTVAADYPKRLGAFGLLFVPGSSAGTTATLGRIAGRNLTSVVSVVGPGGPRMTGFAIRQIAALDCYYAINFQENGDGVEIGQVTTDRCLRSYFAYGVSGHRVSVVSRNGRAPASADVLIKRYRRDTRGIRLTYRAEGSRIEAPNGLVVLEQQPFPGTGPGTISDTTLDLTVDAPASGAVPLLFRSYKYSGESEERSENLWDDITVRFHGVRSSSDLRIDSRVMPRVRGHLSVSGAGPHGISAPVARGFDLQES